MMEIKITGNKKIETINKEIQEIFPYIMLDFFLKRAWESIRKNTGDLVTPLDWNLRIADIRDPASQEESEITINRSLTVFSV
jgi:hypothetical protein